TLRLRLPPGLPEQCFYLGPEVAPRLPFVRRQSRQCLRIAYAGQRGLPPPALHLLLNVPPVRAAVAFQPFSVQAQVRPQPFAGLRAPAGALLLVEPGGVLALAAAGPGGTAGSAVPVRRLQLLLVLTRGRENCRIEAGGGGGKLFGPAHPRELDALRGIR